MLTRITPLVVLLCTLAAVPAAADFRVERTLEMRSGGTFWLHSDHGSVSIVGNSPSGAIVEIISTDNDFARHYNVTFEARDGNAQVVVRRRYGVSDGVLSWWRSWRGVSRQSRILVRVPPSVLVGVRTGGGQIEARQLKGSVRLHTSGGRMRVEQIEGNIDMRTSGGPIEAADVRGNLVAHTSGGRIAVARVQGAVDVRTSGGPIDIDSASGDVQASTSGGNVWVRQAGGRVHARTSGGRVTVQFAPGNGNGGELSTSGGGVIAEVDPTVRLSIDASTSGGRVDADLPITIRGTVSQRAIQGELNGGGPMLRLRSGGGGVRIARAGGTFDNAVVTR